MQTVSIIGAGNVAFHLTRAFIENTIQVKQIYNRTLSKAQKIGESNNIKFTNKISELEKADLYIIAASDKAIEELSLHIPYEDVMVVHTSGSIPIDVLKGNYRKGVLYPLQTFSVERVLQYENIPFFIETEKQEDQESLLKFAKRISNKVSIISSEQRAKVHLSAVWACNFTNHMYYMAQKITEQANIPFEDLLPLIEETASKVQDLSPKKAQTGPAKRNDNIVIDKHLELMQERDMKSIYKEITNSIIKTYNSHEL